MNYHAYCKYYITLLLLLGTSTGTAMNNTTNWYDWLPIKFGACRPGWTVHVCTINNQPIAEPCLHNLCRTALDCKNTVAMSDCAFYWLGFKERFAYLTKNTYPYPIIAGICINAYVETRNHRAFKADLQKIYTCNDKKKRGELAKSLCTDTDILGNTPLHLAIGEGKLSEAVLFLQAGNPIAAKNWWGQSPMDIAYEKNDEQLMVLLLAWGAPLPETSHCGCTSRAYDNSLLCRTALKLDRAIAGGELDHCQHSTTIVNKLNLNDQTIKYLAPLIARYVRTKAKIAPATLNFANNIGGALKIVVEQYGLPIRLTTSNRNNFDTASARTRSNTRINYADNNATTSSPQHI